jgi:hypothetical protein
MSGTSFTRYANCSNGAICGTGGSTCSGSTSCGAIDYDMCYYGECPGCIIKNDTCTGTRNCSTTSIDSCTACGCTLTTTANKFYSSLTSPTLVYTASSVPNTCQWIPPTVASSVEPSGIESMLASIVDAISQLLKSLRGY